MYKYLGTIVSLIYKVEVAKMLSYIQPIQIILVNCVRVKIKN